MCDYFSGVLLKSGKDIKDDYPLQATYELKDFVKLTLILAPRVDVT